MRYYVEKYRCVALDGVMLVEGRSLSAYYSAGHVHI